MHISNNRIENTVSNDDIPWRFVSNNAAVIKPTKAYKPKLPAETTMAIIEILTTSFDALSPATARSHHITQWHG